MSEDAAAGTGPRTLAVDCGGTRVKALALDGRGDPVGDRVRVATPYPCPPTTLLRTIGQLAQAVSATSGPLDRVAVGFPGLVRGGVVRATPHYVTESGPFSAVRADLLQAWTDLDVRAALEAELGLPVRLRNDAEVAGLAVVRGVGFEVVLTLGTGLGCALFDDGRVLPKIELSLAPFRKKQTYDEQLGHHARKSLGPTRWTARVARAVEGLRPVLAWDHLYLGGGGARHLTESIGPDVTVISNDVGLTGGIRLWD